MKIYKKFFLFLLLMPTIVYLSEPPQKKQKTENQEKELFAQSNQATLLEEVTLLASSKLPTKVDNLNKYNFREIGQKREELVFTFCQFDIICKEFLSGQYKEISSLEKAKEIIQTIDAIKQKRKEFSQLKDEVNGFVVEAHIAELKLNLLYKLAYQFVLEQQG